MSRRLINEIESLIEYKDKYVELLYAVKTRFPSESRHKTALRYIRDAENKSSDEGKSAAQTNNE